MEATKSYLRSMNKHSELKRLAELRQQTLNDLQRATNEEVRLRTTLELCKRLDDETRGDLAMVVALLSSMGTGTGNRPPSCVGMHRKRWSDATPQSHVGSCQVGEFQRCFLRSPTHSTW